VSVYLYVLTANWCHLLNIQQLSTTTFAYFSSKSSVCCWL